jgi:TonB family protein
VAYPDSARRRGEEGRVVLVLTVADDGTVARLDATADGASQRLLAAALAAVRRAAPFARSSSGEFRIPIVFRLAPAPRGAGI